MISNKERFEKEDSHFLAGVVKFAIDAVNRPGSMIALEVLAERAKGFKPKVISRPDVERQIQRVRSELHSVGALTAFGRLCELVGQGAGLEKLQPHQLARAAGSWSYVVADDGKCEALHLERLAEINGFRLLSKDKPLPFVIKLDLDRTTVQRTQQQLDSLQETCAQGWYGSTARHWSIIEKWINNEPNAGIEIRRPGVRNHPRKWSVILSVRESRVGETRTYTIKSKAFRADTRDKALELAAAFLNNGGFGK